MSARPVKQKCWTAFLKEKKCHEVTGGHHNKWKCPGCHRSIIFRNSDKDIPFAHIKTNLDTMKISPDDFWAWMAKNC